MHIKPDTHSKPNIYNKLNMRNELNIHGKPSLNVSIVKLCEGSVHEERTRKCHDPTSVPRVRNLSDWDCHESHYRQLHSVSLK